MSSTNVTLNDDGRSTPDSRSKRDIAADEFVRQKISKGRRYFMLALFCAAEFMDAFIASGLFPAINDIQNHLHVKPAEVTWAFAAYSATFSAFLLISGRVADIYSARWCFISGAFIIGAFSLGGGFTHTKVSFFLLRAFAGIGAALNVPAALSLIVEWFPDPEEQNTAIALFGGGGGIGNILGVIIGGIFVEWATWRWILWFTGIAGIGIALLAAVLVPPSAPRRNKPSWKRLDLGGVSLITVAIVLFVYAVTSGPVNGWGSANVIAPLIISVAMAVAFFTYEAYIDPERAALPPRVWKYPNVPVVVALGLIPFFWWGMLFFQLMPLMQAEYHWSAIMSSVRFLPAGISGTLVAGIAATLVKYVSPKWTISAGLVLEFIASMLLPFANTRERYWSFLFPAFFIGSIGTMVIYTNSNIAIFMNTPPEMAGVAGAMFNSALQLGIALGVAIVASITQSIDKKRIEQGKEPGYTGIADGYWFVVAFVAFMLLMVQIFYKVEPRSAPADAEGGAGAGGKRAESEYDGDEKPGHEKAGENLEAAPHASTGGPVVMAEAALAIGAVEDAAMHHQHQHAPHHEHDHKSS